MTNNLINAIAAMKLLGPEEMLILIAEAQQEMQRDMDLGMSQAVDLLGPND